MNFFECISRLDSYKNNISAMIVRGSGIGNKAIWSDRELVYYDGEEEYWSYKTDEVYSSRDCSIITSDGNDLYIEKVHNTAELIVCGAGHVSIPIIKIGKMLGFHITVIDDRPKFANQARAAGADIVYCEYFEDALKNINGTRDSYFVIVTRGHLYDQICLENIIKKEAAYIGMIGSRIRVRAVKEALTQKGILKEKLDEIYSPIGLSINAQTPEEIAVAIIAELIQVKNQTKRGSEYERDTLKILLNEENIHKEKALITIIERKGSSPRNVGTKMIVFRDGTTIGTIGGGCMEAEVLNRAILCMDKKENEVMEFDMTGEAEEEGMICGGIIKLLIVNI
jgi:xanthine dehydrogenase accessory factor